MSRLIEIKEAVLSKNDSLAADLRQRFEAAGCVVTNWVSSPGSGKTALLEATMGRLIDQGYAVAALVGDLATENDAKRLRRSGAVVNQIVTAGICHLEAEMVANFIERWDLAKLDFLFIENVGNLVCPASYDLGEAERIVLISVTEGEDKPLKYPPMFQAAGWAIITKIDLADAVELNRNLLLENIRRVGPHLKVFETSAKGGQGIETLIHHLIKLKKRPSSPDQTA